MKTALIILAALSGFAFGRQDAPKGTEWQSPEELSLNKELPHASFVSFEDVDGARAVLPENSSLWKSLDGQWKFNWVPTPDARPADFWREDYDTSSWDDIEVPSNWNVYGLQHDGSQKYGAPIYVNVNVPWFYKSVPGDWKLGVMRTPPEDWTMYAARNEVGSYKRSFELPESWAGKEVFIDFDGVDSFFYLWVNGQYVGFSKNSRNLAQFNISEYLKSGENTVAVEVYRNSDASNFEAQDMFRLPGIFRTVALEARPKAHIRDLRVTPTSTSLKVEVETVGACEGCKMAYSLYENELYSDENSLVENYDGKALVDEIEYAEAKPWSAESPQRYVLVAKLCDKDGKVLDIVSTYTGFRVVELRELSAEEDEYGNAGRYFLLNGKAVKLRGVNRHETHPEVGHAVTREMMLEDVMLMKRANINHVRDSHYPDSPYWYYLCDKYGIYLMDEANLESHHYGYGEASLSHPVEWLPTHLARMAEMMHQNYNHPSVIIWSMGNEAGPGDNFKAAYEAAKAFDPMRPVQYERNNDISDIGCRQYPAVAWVEKVATGTANVKYPYHINEFAHSMGNAMGNFADYWRAMDSSSHFIGGCIWDWVDQSIWNWTADGTKYLAYGGDFGDKPNDGQFVMNGIIFGDREPKPAYYEVKKVYQNVYTELVSSESGCIKVKASNRNFYEGCSYKADWTLLADGKAIAKGSFLTGEIAPRESKDFEIKLKKAPQGKECYLNIIYRQTEDLPWAAAGYDVCSEQLFIQPGTACVAKKRGGQLSFSDNGDFMTVSGKGFVAVFDAGKGTLHSLKMRGRDVIVPGHGPELNVFRAFVNNDVWICDRWFELGLHNLQHSASDFESSVSDEAVVLKWTVTSKAPNAGRLVGDTSTNYNDIEELDCTEGLMTISSKLTWTIRQDGSIECSSDIDSDMPEEVVGRVGYTLQVPQEYKTMKYYGRGPIENYCDRYTCAFVGIYESEVMSQLTNYTKPQDMSNHEQVRWVRFMRKKNRGVEFAALHNSLASGDSGQPVMSVSAVPYDATDLVKASHTFQLPEPGDTRVCLDAAELGLGGASCGPAPLERDRTHAKASFGFVIRPAGRK